MKNRQAIGLAAVFALAVVAAPAAEAICPTSRYMQLGYIYNPAVGYTSNQSDVGSTVSSRVQGSFWVIGEGNPLPMAGIDNGTWEPLAVSPSTGYTYGPDAGWLTVYPGYPAFSTTAWNYIGALAADGCPDSASVSPPCIAVLLTDEIDGVGYFLLTTEQADASLNYVFNDLDSLNVATIPSPTIVGSSNLSSTQVELAIAPPSISDGLYFDPACLDPIVAYRVVAQILPAGSSPPVGRDIADWGVDLSGPVAPGVGSSVIANCAGGDDVYLAIVLEFESGFETAHVSSNSTRVECGPSYTDVEERPRVRPGGELQIKSRGGKRREY